MTGSLPPARTHSADTWLGMGREALEAYDYDGARAALERALARDPGHRGAARELLELLVDLLAADSDATALGETLRGAAREDPTCRVFVALAAARTGQVATARAWLPEEQGGERRADVWAALAERALEGDRLEEARECLVALERLDRYHASLSRLQQRLEERRAEARRPAEASLQAALDAGDEDRMEAEARAILERWPDSALATRVVADLERRRLRRDLQKREQRLRTAVDERDLPRAERLLREYREAGGEEEAPARAVEALRERLRREQREQERQQVARRFERDLPGALSAWLALDSSAREQVKQEVSRPELSWLEVLDPPRSGSRAQEAVAGVMALARAHEHLEAERFPEALEALEPHARALRGLGEAREVRRRAHEAVRSQELSRFHALARQVEHALLSGDLAEARRVLERLEGLERTDAEQVRALRGRLERLEHRRSWIERADALVRADDPVRLRMFVGREPPDRDWELPAGIRRALEGLDHRIRQDWRVHRVEEPAAPQRSEDWFVPVSEEQRPNWLLWDPLRVVRLMAAERWLRVAEVEPGTGSILRQVVMRLPQPVEVVDYQVVGHEVRVFGAGGELLVLGVDMGEIRAWHPRDSVDSGMDRVEWGFADAAGKTAWIGGTGRDGDPRLRVWSLDRETVQAPDPTLERARVRRIPGASPERVLLLPPDRDLWWAEPGAEAPPERQPWSGPVHDGVVPGDPGAVLLLHRAAEHAYRVGGDAELALSFLGPRGKGGEPLRLEGSRPEAPARLAADVEAGRIWVRYARREAPRNRLAAFELAGPRRLRPLWDVACPEGSVLVQHAGGQGAVLAGPDGHGGTTWHPLGAEAPQLAIPSPSPFRNVTWRLAPPYPCLDAHRARRAGFGADPGAPDLPDLESAARRGRQALQRAARLASGAARLTMSDEVLEQAGTLDPTHGALALERADRILSRARDRAAHERVLAVLDPVDPTTLEPVERQHYGHLRGTALLHADRPEQALEVLLAHRVEGVEECHVEPAIALAAAVAAPTAHRQLQARNLSVMMAIQALRQADAALEQDRHVQAIEALEVEWFRGVDELQSRARMAAAWLERAPQDAGQAVERLLALAAFADRADRRRAPGFMDLDLPLGEARWSDARIDALRQRVAQALERWRGP